MKIYFRYSFFILFLLFPGLSQAATLTVTNTNDSGAGSLRQTIADASSGDTINFDAAVTGTILLSSGELSIDKSLSIVGPGADILALSANYLSRVLGVGAAADDDIVISGLTLKEGAFVNHFGGSCVRISLGNVSLSDLVIENCEGGAFQATGLGAIYHDSTGDVTLSNTIIRNNSAGGGAALYSSGAGDITMTDVTITENETTGYGGGIYKTSLGTLELNRVTLNANTVSGNGGSGGGLFVDGTNAILANVTITGNSTTGSVSNGGGLAVANGGTATLNNVSISDNSATADGGGIYIENGSSLTISNSIISGSTSGGDCAGTVTDAGSNLVEDNSCGFTGGSDPLFAALADNGGLTETLALAYNSPAIDAGDNATCETEDQRGVSRPQGSACDIGAFEFSPSNFNFSSATYTVNQDAGTLTVTVTRNIESGGAYDGEVTVDYTTTNGTALAGTNYTTASGTLTWSNGESTDKTFTVDIANSGAINDLTFNLELNNPTGGASVGSTGSAVVTIAGNSASLRGSCGASLHSPLIVNWTVLSFVFLSLCFLICFRFWRQAQ